MAFRISADTDFLDARLAQAALLDHRERVGKRPRDVGVTADHQEPAHIGFAEQAREQVRQILGCAQAPRRDMHDGLQSGFTQQRRRGNQFRRRDCRHRREIDRGCRRQQFSQRGDLAGIGPGHLERKTLHEIVRHGV